VEGRTVAWRMPLGQIKSGMGAPYYLSFTPAGEQLIVTGKPQEIRFLDPETGKVQRKVPVEEGPRKYGIQEVVVDSKQRWIAYVNEDNGKVLDLTARSPVPLADLKNAAGLALSLDGTELWTVSRKVLAGFDTSTWKQTGEWILPSAPIATSTPMVRVGSPRLVRLSLPSPRARDS